MPLQLFFGVNTRLLKSRDWQSIKNWFESELSNFVTLQRTRAFRCSSSTMLYIDHITTET